MPLTRDVLTPQEVADYLQLAPDTVYRYIREGKLVASKMGASISNSEEERGALLAGNVYRRGRADAHVLPGESG